ncbi:MAG: DUF2087 domain-containing protein, partial [Cyanobacteria bacterium P01_A01_bin.80]
MNNSKLETWENKVLQNYLDGTLLKEIPASRKKRFVILKWLVAKFELDVTYTERQVASLQFLHTLRERFQRTKFKIQISGGLYPKLINSKFLNYS